MKKVCNLSNNDKEIIRNLYENREGLRTKTLLKLTDLKQRVLYKRLNILKDKGLIENISPIWKIVNGGIGKCAILLKDSKIFELHNLSYIVKLLKTPEWWKNRKNYLIRLKEWQFKNINFGKGNSNPYQQLINENFVIQCYPESLIIIARKRYYADDPYDTIKQAINDVIAILEWFCERFRFDFFNNGIPHIQTRNNDFNRMNDALANRVKKEGASFLVELDKRRKVWVDMSEPFGKEANYPEAQEILEKQTKDLLINKPPVLSEVWKITAENSQDLNILINTMNSYGSHIKSHTESIIALSKAIPQLTRLLKETKEENKNLKQRRLSDF
jgi:hypothetical protein